MTIPATLAQAARRAVKTDPLFQDPALMRPKARPQLRRYEVMSLLPNGDIAETQHVAPALPLFENAFLAFCRGALVETDHGPVAVEDLLPGDRIVTGDGDARPLLWIGSTRLAPRTGDSQRRHLTLTRIMANNFGIGRPAACVMAGPAARLKKTPAHLKAHAGDAPLLTPVAEFVDGMNVIETNPPTPVQMFHLCLPRHAVIRVGGLEFETYHPGMTATRTISHAMRSVYLNLFPHVDTMADFGTPCHARAGDGEIDALSA